MRSDTMDVVVAVILGLSAVLIAWSAFQGTLWASETTRRFNTAGAARVESAKDIANLNRQLLLDQGLFASYTQELSVGNIDGSELLLAQMRDEFRPLVVEWATAGGATDLTVPLPFDSPDYDVNDSLDAAISRSVEAEDAASSAREASDQRDVYAGLAVAFALVLFFVGVSSTARSQRVAYAGTAIGGLILVGASIGLLLQEALL